MSVIFRRSGVLLLTLVVLLFSWGCSSHQPLASLEITNCDRTELLVGATLQLVTNAPDDLHPLLSWESSGSCLTVDGNGL